MAKNRHASQEHGKVQLIPLDGGGFRIEAEGFDYTITFREAQAMLRDGRSQVSRLILLETFLADNWQALFTGYALKEIPALVDQWYEVENEVRAIAMILEMSPDSTWHQLVERMNVEVFGRDKSGRKLEDPGATR